MLLSAPSALAAFLAFVSPVDHAPPCAALDGRDARLACWDAASGRPAPPPRRIVHVVQPAPPLAQGRWRVRVTPGFGGDEVVARLASADPVGCGGGHATLFLRCIDDRTSLHLVHGCDTRGAHGAYAVETVLDGAEGTVAMTADAEGDALGLWAYADARPFAERLVESDALVLRFRDDLDRTKTARFPTRGAGIVVDLVRRACGW